MQSNAVIYCRISQDRTGAGLGVQRQEADCRELAASMGLSVVATYADNDLSAYSTKPRPAYMDMLKRLAESEVNFVLVWHTDRLHRSPVELENYIDVCAANDVKTFSVRSGELDLATPSGRVSARMFGTLARYESEHKAERISRKMEELSRQGKWTGGTRPFGWQVEGTKPILDDVEAASIRSTFQAVLKGQSLGSIVRELNAQGLTTSRGKQWGYAQLTQMLKRPRNAGLAEFRGEIVGPSEFPAIVSEDVYRAVLSILGDPDRRRSQSNKARHLLAGIAQCHCGALVRSATVRGRNGKSYFVYRCPEKGPGHVGKKIEYVDDVVNRSVIAHRILASSMSAGRNQDARGERDGLEAEAEALRTRLDEAARMAADGVISLGQLATMTEQIRSKQASLEARMIEIVSEVSAPQASMIRLTLPGAVDLESLEAREWLDLPVDARRDYLRWGFHVVLYPHSKGSPRIFDTSTVVLRPQERGRRRGPLTVDEIGSYRSRWREDLLTEAEKYQRSIPPHG